MNGTRITAFMPWCMPSLLMVLLSSTTTGRAESFPDVSRLPSIRGLPDPLVMFDGARVTTKQQWYRQRRPELRALFQHYMYGYVPPAPGNVKATADRVDKGFFGGKVTKKEVTLEFGPPGTPKIHLLLIIPNRRQGPAPVFLALNKCGNHTVVTDAGVAVSGSWCMSNCPGCKNNRPTAAGRGSRAGNWAVENTIDRGYALATFHESDVDPDKHDFSDGVHPHYRKAGQEGQGPHDWGTIAAWAWGLHRAVDYLTMDQDIDNHRICVTGHSRRGKTALLAAAMDERIDLVIPHQAGCGGTSPSRSPRGESVKQINDRFPHWFNGTFPQFNERVDRLPFDQHSLIALVAPRPVLLTNALEDEWADPRGQFEALQAADPVYRFLGAEGLEADEMPPAGRLIDSNLGYYIRPGRHSTTPEDWKVFLDFAEKRFGANR
jgi:hypothetical protein